MAIFILFIKIGRSFHVVMILFEKII